MRPIKLTLTAFGPYKDKEVIDFEKLAENQLFVISGQTGSGKTTIFDGISFALYGAASGEDRDDTSLLRSHFADDDIHTSAELIFELNDRKYRVLRQIGHVKEGNKTKTGDNYEFFEIVDQQEVPMVDRQNVTNINEKIEQLIGLTQDQFKQIVMLPQGEFRRLLTSETENKEEILRRLFQTDSYQQIGEQLKERRDTLQTEFNEMKQRRDHYIQMIHGTFDQRSDSQLFQTLNADHFNTNQVIEHLVTEVQYYEEQVKSNEQAVKQANKLYEQKHSSYIEAKQINESFNELKDKKEQLTLLHKQAEQMTEKEKLLTKAEQANDVIPFENVFNERQQNVKHRQEVITQIKETDKQVKQALNNAQATYDKEKNNEEHREKLRQHYDKLVQILPTVENLAQNRTNLTEKVKQIKKQQASIAEMTKELEEKSTEKRRINETITKYELATRTYVETVRKLNELKKKYDYLNQYSAASSNHETLTKDLLVKKKEYQVNKRKYRENEFMWLNDQAAILAADLQENDPCPVCGGTDHPAKATHHVAGITKEELDRMKTVFDAKSAAYNEAKALLASSEKELKLYRAQAKEYGVEESDLAEVLMKLIDQVEKWQEEIDGIEQKHKQLDQLRKNDRNLTVEIESLEQNITKENEKKQSIKDEYTEIRAVYKERLAAVPEELQQLDKLNKTIKETADKRERLERLWKQAEDNLQAAKLKATEISSQLSSANQELVTATEEQDKAKKAFLTAIEEMQFVSVEQYQVAKLTKEKQQELKTEIEQYKRQVDQLKRDISTLKQRLKDKEKVDLTELKIEVNRLKENYENTLNILNSTKSIVQEAKTIYKNIKQEHEKVKEHEGKLRIVIDLYDVIRGQNDKRISFERYLQIGYLEQIIDAANERLRELSNGQFLLMRSERQETYGRQSGLALDIYDAYTGQARDVKSLSGGEKFNTSLCLALGMSDVIQSFQGGISIETMFIDEGFGSLDEEALNKALDTLVDLQQSGRMIGVISHVDQLKSIFPAVLEVQKLKEGYSTTSFVIK